MHSIFSDVNDIECTMHSNAFQLLCARIWERDTQTTCNTHLSNIAAYPTIDSVFRTFE